MRHPVVEHDLAPAPPRGRQRHRQDLDPRGVDAPAPHHLGLALGREAHGGAAEAHPGGRAAGLRVVGEPQPVRLPGAPGQWPVLERGRRDPHVPPVGSPGRAVEQGHGAQTGGPRGLPVVPELVEEGEVEPGLGEPRLQVGGAREQRPRVLVPAVADEGERAIGGLPPGGGGPVPSLAEDPHDSRLHPRCRRWWGRGPLSRRTGLDAPPAPGEPGASQPPAPALASNHGPPGARSLPMGYPVRTHPDLAPGPGRGGPYPSYG
ncbi:hypothetical protein STTU_2023 [Streptomyces sp. Tu6071]|nr:hypothetical protein STTU_2023 [Streptomyces sp. Tu6071]